MLPQVDSDSTASKRRSWLKRPWTMFLLGCVVATLTLSVSVALTVLVPLAVKGYVKRDEALPYIMGANITTLADTLVVAMLQPGPGAAQVVLAEAIGVTIVSVFILAFLYRPVKDNVLRLDDFLVASNARLAGFVAVLFTLPIVFILTGLFFRTVSRDPRGIAIAPMADATEPTPEEQLEALALSDEEKVVLARVGEILRRVNFGTVVLVVQDGKVVQIEMAEKFRLR